MVSMIKAAVEEPIKKAVIGILGALLNGGLKNINLKSLQIESEENYSTMEQTFLSLIQALNLAETFAAIGANEKIVSDDLHIKIAELKQLVLAEFLGKNSEQLKELIKEKAA